MILSLIDGRTQLRNRRSLRKIRRNPIGTNRLNEPLGRNYFNNGKVGHSVIVFDEFITFGLLNVTLGNLHLSFAVSRSNILL